MRGIYDSGDGLSDVYADVYHPYDTGYGDDGMEGFFDFFKKLNPFKSGNPSQGAPTGGSLLLRGNSMPYNGTDIVLRTTGISPNGDAWTNRVSNMDKILGASTGILSQFIASRGRPTQQIVPVAPAPPMIQPPAATTTAETTTADQSRERERATDDEREREQKRKQQQFLLIGGAALVVVLLLVRKK